MGWERARGGRRAFYTRSHKIGGRVRRRYIGGGKRGREASELDAKAREGGVALRTVGGDEVDAGTVLPLVKDLIRRARDRLAAPEVMDCYELLVMGKTLWLAENLRRVLSKEPRLEDAPPGPTRLLVTYSENGIEKTFGPPPLTPADSPPAMPPVESAALPPSNPAGAVVDRGGVTPDGPPDAGTADPPDAGILASGALTPPAVTPAAAEPEAEPLDEVDQFIADILSGNLNSEVLRQREEAAKMEAQRKEAARLEAERKAAELGEQEWRARLIREREDARAHLAAELAEKDRARRARLIEDAEERTRRAAELGVL